MKKSFRFLALALLPVLLAGMLVPCFAWSEPNDLAVRRYKDLSAKAWYYEDVAWVAKTGLMQYSNDPQKFEPQSPLTRAMFTQICYNFLSKGLEKDVSYDAVAPFTDVKKAAGSAMLFLLRMKTALSTAWAPAASRRWKTSHANRWQCCTAA